MAGSKFINNPVAAARKSEQIRTDDTNISGKTNIPMDVLTYEGVNTDTAEVIVDNNNKKIAVNVKGGGGTDAQGRKIDETYLSGIKVGLKDKKLTVAGQTPSGKEVKSEVELDIASSGEIGLYQDIDMVIDPDHEHAYWFVTNKIDAEGYGDPGQYDPDHPPFYYSNIISGPYNLGAGGGGGGGEGLTTVTLNVLQWPTVASTSGKECVIKVTWSSLKRKQPTGVGTMELTIENSLGKEVISRVVDQGEVDFDLINNIAPGTNKITIVVTDMYGTSETIANQLRGVNLYLESNFEADVMYTGRITYTYIPWGNVKKQVHLIVDENLPSEKRFDPPATTKSGEQLSYVLTGLSHGSHTLRVYFEATLDGKLVPSNELFYDLIFVEDGNKTPIIASAFRPEEEKFYQYQTFAIPYQIYTPGKTTSTVELFVNDLPYGTPLTVGQMAQSWVYKPMSEGDFTFKIKSGTAEKIFNVHIAGSTIPIMPTESDLVLDLNAVGRTNTEDPALRNQWISDTVVGSEPIKCKLEGFNWSSNGWVTGDDGQTVLRISGPATVEIPYVPFPGSSIKNTGKTFEFEISTKDVKSYSSIILSCIDSSTVLNYLTWTNMAFDDRKRSFQVSGFATEAREGFDGRARFLEAVNDIKAQYVFTYIGNQTWALNRNLNKTEQFLENVSTDNVLLKYGVKFQLISQPDAPADLDYFIKDDKFAVTYEQAGVGIYLTPQLMRFQGQLSGLTTQYKEEDHVRISFVIDKNTKDGGHLLYMYINGIMSGVAAYPISEQFKQKTSEIIKLGTTDATATLDVYRIRIYDAPLTRNQIINNWIADTDDGELKAERYMTNNILDENGKAIDRTTLLDRKQVPCITFIGPALPEDKTDKLKTVDVEYTNSLEPDRSFTSQKASIKVQGQSSQYYYKKNFKVKFKNGFIDKDGNIDEHYHLRPTSKKEKTYVFKADVASSEGTNNVELVRYFEDTKNWYSPAELVQDPDDIGEDGKNNTKERIRVGIDGLPVVAFYDKQDGQVPQFYGKMNFNNDKGNKRTFGFIEGDEAWEFINNSNAPVMFLSDDLSNWQASFESRYPDDELGWDYGTQPEDLVKLHDVLGWVKSTNTKAATGEALPEAVTYTDPDTKKTYTYTEDTAAYRLAKFKYELEDHFDLTSSLYYYLFTELFLLVDSWAKNAVMCWYANRYKTATGKVVSREYEEDGTKNTLIARGNKWYWIPYDMDTALGINNEGLLVFNYDAETTDKVNGTNVYNGQNSVFWNNIRMAFEDKLNTMYKDLRSSVWSFDSIEKYYEEHQAAWGERIYNEDAVVKYLEPYFNSGNTDTTYFGMAQGSKAQQRRWWMNNRFKYMDSKYKTGNASSQYIMIRAYAAGSFEITPYINCYPTALFDNIAVQTAKAYADEPIVLNPPEGWVPGGSKSESGGSDSVLSLYSANLIREVKGISSFMPGYANFAAATKLQKLDVSCSAAAPNLHLTGINVGTNKLLTEIDARNCRNLGYGDGKEVTPTIDLSGCVSIEKAFFDNTQILGCTFPVGGYLTEVHLPESINTLEIRNHPNLKVLQLGNNADGSMRLDKLTSVWLEDIPADAVSAQQLVAGVAEGCTMRLIGIKEHFSSVEKLKAFFDKLETLEGMDEFGNTSGVDISASVTGDVYIDRITYAQYKEFITRFHQINIHATYIDCVVSFYFDEVQQAAGTYYAQKTVTYAQVAGVPAVITNPPADPSESYNAQYHRTFVRWDAWDGERETWFKNITTDMDVLAIWNDALRTYRVIYNTQSPVIEAEPAYEDVPYGSTLSGEPTFKNIPELVEQDGYHYLDKNTGRKQTFTFDMPIDDVLPLDKGDATSPGTSTLIIYCDWNDTGTPHLEIYPAGAHTLGYYGTDNVGLMRYCVKKVGLNVDVDTLPDPTDLEWIPVPNAPQAVFEGQFAYPNYQDPETGLGGSGLYVMWVQDNQGLIGKAWLEGYYDLWSGNPEAVAFSLSSINDEGQLTGDALDWVFRGTKIKLFAEVREHYQDLVCRVYYNDGTVEIVDPGHIFGPITCGFRIDFSTAPMHYDAHFDMNPLNPEWELEETVPTQYNIEYKHLVEEPGPMVYKGFFITGWYLDKACTRQWHFDTDGIDRNIILYAKWEMPTAPALLRLTIPASEESTDITLNLFADLDALLTIDWGDGTSKTIDISETRVRKISEPHEYAASDVARSYEITIELTRGTYAFGQGDLNSSVIDQEHIKYLFSVSIPFNINIPMAYAFINAVNLTNTGVNPAMTKIEDRVYKGCSNIRTIAEVASDMKNIKTIGAEAFMGCFSADNITSPITLELPRDLTKIGTSCFNSCRMLGTVYMPSKIINIGAYAFQRCANLTRVINSASVQSSDRDFPEGLSIIGSAAFGNSGLTSVVLPQSLTRLDSSAFEYCNSLASVIIHSSQVILGDYLFRTGRDASGQKLGLLTSIGTLNSDADVRLADIETIGDSVFREMLNLRSAFFSESLKTIGDNAFAYCSALSTLTLPSSLETIGAQAFDTCAISSLRLYDKIKDIGRNAFMWTILTEIWLGMLQVEHPINVPDKTWFFHCSSTLKIHVSSYFANPELPVERQITTAFGSCFNCLDEAGLNKARVIYDID